MSSYSKIGKERLASLVNLVTNSLDLTKTQVRIRGGIFEELDNLRERYDQLDVLMGERLSELAEDIKCLPKFMHKVRMMMIPSVGYFTVVNKLDQAYLDFLNENLPKHESLKDSNDEDVIFETLLGDSLDKIGWKLCFMSESDIYF